MLRQDLKEGIFAGSEGGGSKFRGLERSLIKVYLQALCFDWSIKTYSSAQRFWRKKEKKKKTERVCDFITNEKGKHRWILSKSYREGWSSAVSHILEHKTVDRFLKLFSRSKGLKKCLIFLFWFMQVTGAFVSIEKRGTNSIWKVSGRLPR